MKQTTEHAATDRPKCPLPKWSRRFGAFAFLFFLIKGLLWLIIPALAATGVLSWF